MALSSLKSTSLLLAAPLAILWVAVDSTLLSHAALPDRQVQNLVFSIYSHHLATDRSSCDYHVNPNDLAGNQTSKRLLVLRTQGKSGGSACNGVFEFEVLTADCEKDELSISNEVGSPASWIRRQYRNSVIVREVCGGLEQPIPSQIRLLQSLSHPLAQPPVAPIPVITQQEAIDLVKVWLSAKSRIFAPPFDLVLLDKLTTGTLYQDIATPNKGMDWLKTHDAQWQFGIQTIGCVAKFAAYRNGQASIDLWVTEDRRLLVKGKTDRRHTAYKTELFRYEFRYVGDRWKIADYNDVEGVKRPRSTCS